VLYSYIITRCSINNIFTVGQTLNKNNDCGDKKEMFP